ncbi:MAG: preprotein translocase subunit SecG [Bacteroidetes bacterium]|nr:preprotein translocase subunit SecG [Bacteroidota bacterium]
MFSAIITITLILAFFLVISILLQSSKGTGLAGSAFGSGASAVMGVRRTADLLSRTTTVLAVLIAVLCILSNFLIPRSGTSEGSFIDKAGNKAPASAPAQPGK